ncbi:hypothetical protein RDWZM_002797 [Blomia tropicalis]|uniref:Uncharacterized protein n=1 Tax=Blomia tropicalis TaxID=40697 RepID=A0A9Q0MGZ5_BLOTA|nr:hypothetical protein RDWZM_002797 [Blomia tropicalis]
MKYANRRRAPTRKRAANERFKRRNIEDILSNSELSALTRRAKRADLAKRKRLAEKEEQRKSYPFATDPSRVVLDFDSKTGEILVEIDPGFVEYMKPHQIEGVRFMFNATIESIERLEMDPRGVRDGKATSSSYGGILAHCMGLGKTFQVISFITSILANEKINEKIKKVLIVVPLNVIKNWQIEWEQWLLKCNVTKCFPVIELNSNGNKVSTTTIRAQKLNQWHKEGGILLTTPSLLSLLISDKKRKYSASESETFWKCLLDPGPDLVIIDEGHCLKNEATELNITLSEVRTSRRIILTGTPMQNNLKEYFTMINFVKPNFLGTKEEFNNQYVNPITNGQYVDSTEEDVKLMKKRFFVLNKSLKHTTIHRKGPEELESYLPTRNEFVLNFKLTPKQKQLYQYYLDHYVFGTRLIDSESEMNTGERKYLFLHFQILSLIWNHPALLGEYFSSRKKRIDGKVQKQPTGISSRRLIENNLLNNLTNDTTDWPLAETENISEVNPRTKVESLGVVSEMMRTWDVDLWPTEPEWYSLAYGAKFEFLFSILSECEIVGDKVLIFSQSLFTLDLIERFLTERKFGSKNVAYFRIDGSVGADDRNKIVEKFNDENYMAAKLVLISTKAGGVGINLIGANRAIIFDTCWNPAQDVQAIYRIFRYGQKKPVYIYRFAAHGTMESKIYKRQIQKQSISLRVVDECQIERHYKDDDLRELYTLESDDTDLPLLPPTDDPLLCKVMAKFRKSIYSYHSHNSLLENLPGEKLSQAEELEAWKEFEESSSRPSLPPQNLSMPMNNNYRSSPLGSTILNYNSSYNQPVAFSQHGFVPNNLPYPSSYFNGNLPNYDSLLGSIRRDSALYPMLNASTNSPTMISNPFSSLNNTSISQNNKLNSNGTQDWLQKLVDESILTPTNQTCVQSDLQNNKLNLNDNQDWLPELDESILSTTNQSGIQSESVSFSSNNMNMEARKNELKIYLRNEMTKKSQQYITKNQIYKNRMKELDELKKICDDQNFIINFQKDIEVLNESLRSTYNGNFSPLLLPSHLQRSKERLNNLNHNGSVNSNESSKEIECIVID